MTNKWWSYDLFIYTEDDIRVSPRTVASYLYETTKIKQLVGPSRATEFNVGIVRYEYNYPSNVIIDDRTRHATQNVTRVYWEHGRYVQKMFFFRYRFWVFSYLFILLLKTTAPHDQTDLIYSSFVPWHLQTRL